MKRRMSGRKESQIRCCTLVSKGQHGRGPVEFVDIEDDLGCPESAE